MQCSARLPVYGLLLAMLFGQSFVKSALFMTLIYGSRIALAGVISLILSKLLRTSTETGTFHIELPHFRMPIWSNIIRQVFQQTKSFVKGAGSIIIFISIGLWILSEFPSADNSFAMMLGKFLEPLFIPMGVDWRVGVLFFNKTASRDACGKVPELKTEECPSQKAGLCPLEDTSGALKNVRMNKISYSKIN